MAAWKQVRILPFGGRFFALLDEVGYCLRKASGVTPTWRRKWRLKRETSSDSRR